MTNANYRRMRRLLIGAISLVVGVGVGVSPLCAQSMDDLNIQIHGYATQGFIYTTDNNILTTESSDGSAAWTEAMVNVTAQPSDKLRIAVQARYFLLGTLGNAITLDYASADYKINDKLGVRVGKVKVPSSLFNEVQDIDPAYMWALLPTSNYEITSRTNVLSDEGGVVYGAVPIGEKVGNFEYRAWGGESQVPSDDGYLIGFKDQGITFPNGLVQSTEGGAIHLRSKLGLLLGVSEIRYNGGPNPMTMGPYSGQMIASRFYTPHYFANFEHKKIMIAYEYSRFAPSGDLVVPGIKTIHAPVDYRAWFAMASYKLTDKLSAGIYDDQFFDRAAPQSLGRYEKTWSFAARYDFSQFLYAKVQQEVIHGTALGYDTEENPGGLKPTTNMTILKMGVNF